jgi:nucleotide-binding universal stress UspA family protein
MNENNDRKLKIVLAIDGSENSEAAIRMLQDLPIPAGSLLALVSVVVPRDASSYSELEDLLILTVRRFHGKGLLITSDLLVGFPTTVLTEFIHEQNPDFVVLGVGETHGSLSLLVGSLAQNLIQQVDCPLLIARAPYTGLYRILLATDESESSQRAAEWLGSFPLPPEIEVRLVHVLKPALDGSFFSRILSTVKEEIQSASALEATENQKHDLWEKDGMDLLARASRQLQTKNKGGENSGTVLVKVLARGDPARRVVSYAEMHGMDMIVAGTRGQFELGYLLKGDVSRKILHYADCSIMFVKSLCPPKDE